MLTLRTREDLSRCTMLLLTVIRKNKLKKIIKHKENF
jgi:hypothetical protein